MTDKYISDRLKEKNAKVEWFMGYCFLVDKATGKRLSNESHKNYDSAIFELRFL